MEGLWILLLVAGAVYVIVREIRKTARPTPDLDGKPAVEKGEKATVEEIVEYCALTGRSPVEARRLTVTTLRRTLASGMTDEQRRRLSAESDGTDLIPDPPADLKRWFAEELHRELVEPPGDEDITQTRLIGGYPLHLVDSPREDTPKRRFRGWLLSAEDYRDHREDLLLGNDHSSEDLDDPLSEAAEAWATRVNILAADAGGIYRDEGGEFHLREGAAGYDAAVEVLRQGWEKLVPPGYWIGRKEVDYYGGDGIWPEVESVVDPAWTALEPVPTDRLIRRVARHCGLPEAVVWADLNTGPTRLIIDEEEWATRDPPDAPGCVYRIARQILMNYPAVRRVTLESPPGRPFVHITRDRGCVVDEEYGKYLRGAGGQRPGR